MAGAFEQAWSLLKALPGQREMADSGRTMTQREMGYGSDDDEDMGSVHPGALSAMRRLQGEGPLDTRSYESEDDLTDEAGNYTPDAKGRLIGTSRQRDVTRSGARKPDTGKFYNPDTGQMEER
jgi:hypothetical protein|tara:strand:+ start:1784 stop:2152 length:369 start_codon:yes stop_codon:yes gene_type:complete